MENPPPSSDSKHNHIFILAGQSNMSGRGGVSRGAHKHWDGVVPPECMPHPSIRRLSAGAQWEAAMEPLHADIDCSKTCGVGPGMAFANAVRERLGTVGLVPCAVGGTAIGKWARGQRLYEDMVRRAKAAAVAEEAEIKGLLWFQGESDTEKKQDAAAYKGRMERLIGDVREDLKIPMLPIIQVVVASGTGRYVWEVRRAQMGIKMENVVSVDAKGLELKEDHLHLTTKAQVELGKMMAGAYLHKFDDTSSSFKGLLLLRVVWILVSVGGLLLVVFSLRPTLVYPDT